jgi:hypothetical protein
MEKATPSKEAMLATLVEVTPAQLREMANLMELSEQRTSSTETILLRLTNRITLFYQPNLKAADKLKERAHDPFEVGHAHPIKPLPEMNVVQ